MKGIEFDLIFNSKEGDLFFKELTTTKNTKIFEVDFIRDIILYFWTHYKKSLILFMFIPFMIYFAVFLTYTTWTMERRQEETDGNTWTIVNYVFMAVSSVFVSLFMYYEIRQIAFHKLSYFRSFWNILDLLSLILNISTIALDIYN